MTVRQLKDILNHTNDLYDVILFDEDHGVLEDLVSVCKNGNAIQLNMESSGAIIREKGGE